MWFFDRTRGRLLERQSKHQATQASEATFDKATLPQQMEIVVLEHAL
jgi:hypothetical protein